ncbi:MAG: M15 family metallopeptidase [Cyclobacteriaceae bacterium]
MKKKIRIIQELLQQKGLYRGRVDGIFGPATLGALNQVSGLNNAWPNTRKMTAFIQMAANEKGIDAGPVDGFWGQRTQYAFDELTFLLENNKRREPWRPDEVVSANRWPRQGSAEFNEFYGPRGSQLVTMSLPFVFKIAWDLRFRARRITCHQKVAESLLKVLENVRDKYGEEDINALRLNHFGGCYNNRLMRGGTQWSTHAWGIALDFDPARNQLTWGRDKAALAHPVYEEWWKCWEEEGWVSLGRQRNFDWMHVQAAEV